MTDYKIIQTINGPEDVKKLSMEQLEDRRSLWSQFWYGGGRDCHALCFLFA